MTRVARAVARYLRGVRVDAAPPESAPPWRLRLVAGWFSLGGWAGALSGSVLLVCVALGVTPLPRVAPYRPWSVPLALVASVWGELD